MSLVIEHQKRDLTPLVRKAQFGLTDIGVLIIDTAEQLDSLRHDMMFAALDGARLNAEHLFQSSRDMLASETLSGAMKAGQKEAKVSLTRNLEQLREAMSIIRDGGKLSLKPAQKFLESKRGS